MSMKVCALFSSLLLFAAIAGAQAPPAAPAAPPARTVQPADVAAQAGANAAQPPADAAPGAVSGPSRLRIGPGDEADFSVYGVSDLTQHVRVSNTGEVFLPLIGSVMVAGLTAEEAQSLIEKKMVEGQYLKNPHVSFVVKDYNSEGVAVLGEVAKPGTYSVYSSRRLYDSFAAAGGLTPRAGNLVTITRKGDITHPEVISLSGEAARSVQNNVPLQPGDTVVVSRAGIVYVVGEVVRPGGFVLENNNSSLSLMQALAMAAGATRVASLKHARIIHRTQGAVETREVDVKKIMSSKASDPTLLAEDILYIPPANGRMAAEHGASSIFSMLTTLAVYRF